VGRCDEVDDKLVTDDKGGSYAKNESTTKQKGGLDNEEKIGSSDFCVLDGNGPWRRATSFALWWGRNGVREPLGSICKCFDFYTNTDSTL
jgi:hypothetical protein